MAISLTKRHATVAYALAVILSLGLVIVVLRIVWDAYADQVLGHYRYSHAPRESLVKLDSKNGVKLRRTAAQSYRAMVKAAREDGVKIVAVSGYRDLPAQHFRFFSKAAKNNQTVRQRSLICAPPGYSEHHTGYSIDIIDGNHLSPGQWGPKFRATAAYRWMRRNASRFHFELSFPQKNRQGVAFEPWHWRYVGDLHSFATFYRARTAMRFPTPLPSTVIELASDKHLADPEDAGWR